MPVETWTVEPSATRDVVLVLDHFRPERHAVTQLYNKHFLGVVYIVDATGWPGCLKLRPAQACKLQYREFFPGDGHYRAVAETMGAIAVHLGLAPRRRAFKAAGWLKELNNLASAARGGTETREASQLRFSKLSRGPLEANCGCE